MCLQAAQVFDHQPGREYEFGRSRLLKPSRATELNLLTYEELDGLPTNNLEPCWIWKASSSNNV